MEVDKAVARDRKFWSDSVEALCAYWRDKIKLLMMMKYATALIFQLMIVCH